MHSDIYSHILESPAQEASIICAVGIILKVV